MGRMNNVMTEATGLSEAITEMDKIQTNNINSKHS